MSFRSLNRGYLRYTALATALAMGLAGTAFAQSTTGGIYGQAEPGDTVVVTSNSGLTRQVPVDASGKYQVNNLPVGTYSVSLQKGGSVVDTRKDVTIKVSGNTEVSFASAGNASSLSAVTVTANALPAIDVTGVDSRTVITSQQLARLPLARSSEAIALLAPGAVQGSGFFTGPSGQSLVSFGGASVAENAYYINGMNVTDPLNGLGGIDLPYGSIEQQETLTGGYSAAFGRSDGGVINMVGKRGTNDWHFGGQVLWTPEALRSDPKNIRLSNGKLYQYRNENKGSSEIASAYVGGPLIKDKLFMFASVEGNKSDDKLVNTVASGTEVRRHFSDRKIFLKAVLQ